MFQSAASRDESAPYSELRPPLTLGKRASRLTIHLPCHAPRSIAPGRAEATSQSAVCRHVPVTDPKTLRLCAWLGRGCRVGRVSRTLFRSEEHTSELQSLRHL